MPWEISIINGTVEQPQPLGSREDVIAAFADALPGVLLQRPPMLPPEFLEQVPTFARETVMRPNLEADFEADDFSIQFYANDEPMLQWVNCEVRGDGNPLPALAAICVDRGWSVIDGSDKTVVDLPARGAPEWERFRQWRDQALRQIAEDDAETE